MWIHEYQDWPNFTWDTESLASKLADIRYRQGYLLGRMEDLGSELKIEASLSTLTNDVVKSAAIENENLNSKEVSASIARQLRIDIAGLMPANRDVEGIVEMILDATQEYLKPLTKARLFSWHAALFPTGQRGIRPITVGSWRTEPMKVVSDRRRVSSCRLYSQKIHFEAPSANRLENEMKKFLDWFNRCNDIDPILKAGIAHFWFVTIHPFADGNGRIARAIGDMALARADETANRFYSLSTQIESERRNKFGRKDYYDYQLEKQQCTSPDITGWIEWFLDCLGRAISSAETMLGKVLFKAQLWDKINQQPINERQRRIINRMLEDDFKGYMNTSKYAKLTKCSNDTALRDIQSLKERGIFIQNPGGGRSTSYRLPDEV